MNPIETSKTIERRLRDYIRRALPLDRAMPALSPKIDAMFDEHKLVQDPYLELLPTYKRGATLEQMANDRVIHRETAEIFAKAFAKGDPSGFHLYTHQQEAVRAVCMDDRNLVVCSGTGSGKTECFLIPLVNHLVGEWLRAGQPEKLEPGVRAMIMYPMNALVNDQLKRLRSILKHAPFVTFGQYTGELALERDEDDLHCDDETLATHRMALQAYRGDERWSGSGWTNDSTLSNEVTKRSVWKDAPAHILVTNYSMLERLLLQPETSRLFQSPWKYIVLDEAHSYDGALGTEIAWLVRRLVRRLGNPSGIRFMATSATLVSDPNRDKVVLRVREEFASKLFPATKESFEVQQGDPVPYETQNDEQRPLKSLPPESYARLVEEPVMEQRVNALRTIADQWLFNTSSVSGEDRKESIFEITQNLIGAERWVKHAEKPLCELINKITRAPEKTVPAGDVLYIMESLCDATSANLIRDFGEIMNGKDVGSSIGRNLRGFLHDDAASALAALIAFLEYTTGSFAKRDNWRHSLHDHSDPRPSSAKNDFFKQKGAESRLIQRVGNRLHLLDEWKSIRDKKMASGLSVDGLYWMLKAASEKALLAEQEGQSEFPQPEDVGLLLSPLALAALKSFLQQHKAIKNKIQEARVVLKESWAAILARDLKDTYGNDDDIETMLTRSLESSIELEVLAKHLHESMKDWEKVDSGRFTIAAHKCWPSAGIEERESGLSALISLALLTRSKAGRPLLDIRYHQLVRGIGDVGVCIHGSTDGVADVILRARQNTSTADAESAEFNLGVCRNCGQPYAMGYSDMRDLRKENTKRILYRNSTSTHEYLHAFAWEQGEPFPDAAETFPKLKDKNVWLHPKSGGVIVGTTPSDLDEGWHNCVWYVKPHDKSKTFLSECPACGVRQNYTDDAQYGEYGVITPYSAQGGQLKLVVLDELLRSSSVSIDPAARRHPGAGRKALVFSDSRRGAAQLAMQYQDLFTDNALMFSLKWAMDSLDNPPESLRKRLFESREDQLKQLNFAASDIALDRIKYLSKCRENRDIKTVGKSLRELLENDGLGRLLEISDEQGNEFSEDDAAILRILQTLRRGGRQTVLKKGLISIDSKALRDARKNISDPWRNARDTGSLSDDNLMDICLNIYKYLFSVLEIDLPKTWPQQLINTDFKKKIVYSRCGTESNVLAFISSAKLLNIVKCEANLDRAKAERLLEEIWPLFSDDNGRSTLVDTGNGYYVLNREDILLCPGKTEGDLRTHHVEAHEKYDDYLLKRPVIPVRSEEHTAQLGKGRASAYQKAFCQGAINILSCSTTFEMGVDLGDLSIVFLSNLPPAVANYRQRAGRAGRRPGAAAYVLSFVGDSSHDRYFFNKASKLLFGPISSPRIYLENKVYRARHLRAEALHHFLSWMDDGDRWRCFGESPDRKGVPIQIDRNWKQAGHFLAGVCSGGFAMQEADEQNKRRKITGKFDPIICALKDWCRECGNALQTYLTEIHDVSSSVDYVVAHDLIWQLLEQNLAEPDVLSPFALGDEHSQTEFRLLSGPNQPRWIEDKFELDHSIYKVPVQTRFKRRFEQSGDGIPENSVSMQQARLLHQGTIDLLSEMRVLPKYGFPVDVIALLPARDDVHGKNVKLERDLSLGLFEFAPKQRIIADKRIYESDKVLIYEPGGLKKALQDYAEDFYLCENCKQPHPDKPGSDGATCGVCGGAISTFPQKFIAPDAFEAKRSESQSWLPILPAARPETLYSGGTLDPRPVKRERDNREISLYVSESGTGELQYLNLGRGRKGFKQDGSDFFLYHRVQTDIAIWLPGSRLFSDDQVLARMRKQPVPFAESHRGTGNRLDFAMESALAAILKAIARVMQVHEREVSGKLYPYPNGGGTGFLLFDSSSGGGGTVLPLVLTGNDTVDSERHKTIIAILEEARKICSDCRCSSPHAREPSNNPEATPLQWSDYMDHRDDLNYRERVACYDCLKCYGNQRQHLALDRWDAARVIAAILSPADVNGGYG